MSFSLSCMTVSQVGWNNLVIQDSIHYCQDPCHTLVHCPVITIVVPWSLSLIITTVGETVFLEPSLLHHSLISSTSLANSNHQFQPSSHHPICFWESNVVISYKKEELQQREDCWVVVGLEKRSMPTKRRKLGHWIWNNLEKSVLTKTCLLCHWA